MLRIIINNTEVDLGDLKGITLQYNGGIFEFDKVEGSYTIPFSLPMSDLNRAVFEYPFRHENVDNSVRKFNAEIWHSGIKIFDGEVESSINNEGKISCTLYVDNGSFYKKLKEKPLNEHDLGGDKAFTFKSEYDYTADDFVMYEVYNEKFLTDSLWEGKATDPDDEKFQNKYDSGSFNFNQYEPCIITPFPLVYKVLEYLFKGLDIVFNDSFFTGNYRRLNIFNINNAVKKDAYYLVDTWYQRNILDTYNLVNHVPVIPAERFLLALQNFFNIVFLFDSTGKLITIDRKAMISSTSYDDLTNNFLKFVTKTVSEALSGYKLKTEKDSKDNAQAWIENLGDYENVKYTESTTYYEGIVMEVKHYYWLWDKWWNFAYDDSGTIRYYSAWQAYPTDTPYTFAKRNFNYFQSFSHGDQDFVVDMILSTLSDYKASAGQYHDSTFSGNTPIQYIPQVDMKGNTWVRYQADPQEFGLRLMMYSEIGEDKLDGTTLTEPFGTQECQNIAVSPYWAYHNRWKEFISWYAKAITAEFEADLKLSASEIKNFDFSKKKLIDKDLFFVKSLKVQFLRDSIAPVTAVMIKA